MVRIKNQPKTGRKKLSLFALSVFISNFVFLYFESCLVPGLYIAIAKILVSLQTAELAMVILSMHTIKMSICASLCHIFGHQNIWSHFLTVRTRPISDLNLQLSH